MWTHGLPDPAHFGRLVYNRAADCLVASMTVRGDDGTPFEAIYGRRAAEWDYRRLDLGGPELSFTDLIACPTTSEIVFNRMAQRAGHPGAFDWDGLGAYDLAAGKTRTLLDRVALSALLDGREGWISAVVSVDGDASRIVVSVGVMPLASASGRAVRYALCEIDLTAPSPREITRLRDAFL